jgi:cell division protein FtsB
MKKIRIKINPYYPLLVVTMALLVFMLGAFINTSRRDYAARQELKGTEEQITRIAEENSQLAHRVKDLQSPEYAEKEIRKNLNMKRAEEEVVFVADYKDAARAMRSSDQSAPSDYQKNEPSATAAYAANARAWIQYIFHTRNQ